MELFDNKDGIKECVARFEELITKEVHMSELFWEIDNALIDYAQYIIKDNDLFGCDGEKSRQLSYMKLLRDLFVKG